jgi:uncharacterized protein (TIGR02679 family)
VSASSPAPALRRALLAGREKREQRGGAGDGTIVVADLDPDEALALDSLLSPRRPVLAGTTLRIALSQFEAALRECGFDPRELYEGVGGGPVRDLPAERAARRELRTGFRGWLLEHEVVRGRPSVGGWLESAIQQGRVHPDLQPLLDQALRIVGVLPGPEPVQRTVLAAEMLGGDPHGLDFGTPLHSLTVSLLAAAAGLGEHTPAREVWSAFDVVVDPISSNVVGLNLPLLGESRVACLARGMHGTHVILTYGQLATVDLRWSAGVPCFSCENPSVVIAAERALGPSCPPLVCTRGRPSDAVRLLLSAAHHAGAVILHHGDFDEAGVQILLDLEDRYGAAPWRFDLASARAALGDGWTKLSGSVTALADLVRDPAVTIPEELVLDTLIADLRAGMTLTQNQR